MGSAVVEARLLLAALAALPRPAVYVVGQLVADWSDDSADVHLHQGWVLS